MLGMALSSDLITIHQPNIYHDFQDCEVPGQLTCMILSKIGPGLNVFELLVESFCLYQSSLFS